MALTLPRCTDRIDSDGFAQALDFAIPLGQGPGLHTFRYSVIPHSGGWREACREAWAFRVPVQAVLQRHPEESVLPGYMPPAVAGTLPACHAFVDVGPEPLVVETFRDIRPPHRFDVVSPGSKHLMVTFERGESHEGDAARAKEWETIANK